MKKRISLLCVLISLILLPVQIFAAGAIDLEQKASLTISYKEDDQPFEDVEFSIYQLATVDKYGSLTVLEEYNLYDIDISGKNDDSWKEIAFAIEGYIYIENIAPSATAKTNEDGIIQFDDLSLGLYLVIGENHQKDEFIYSVDSFLVMLPTTNVLTNEWNYDLQVKPKIEKKDEIKIEKNVIKVWDDKGYKDKRPNEIEVTLLCDGEFYDKVILNEKNNWRYTWTELSIKHKWNIVEKEISKYEVTITVDGDTFIIKNTYIEPPPPPPGLDDTGVMWWPVPVLFGLGLLFIFIGSVTKRKENSYES